MASTADSSRHGAELNPLERMVFHYESADKLEAAKYRSHLKELAEWCLNNPDQVIASHGREQCG